MKTTVKQLFERIRLTYLMIDDDVNEDYWLEKEKEQMKDSFISGRDMTDSYKKNEDLPRVLPFWRKYKYFDDYYSKTYNHERFSKEGGDR